MTSATSQESAKEGTLSSVPEPADGFEVLLITGMSGAGRSQAANSIEDMGWYDAELVIMSTSGTSSLVGVQDPQAGLRHRRAFAQLFR